MPSKSSGRIAKVRKINKATPHNKNHRWESFSTKITKFSSLQPLRRVRRHDLESEDVSTTTSYLQNGLARWSELNISLQFCVFKRELLPMSESLPQILHFEDSIMDLLAHHVSIQDKNSLEPLLDLLTAFAHDLGARFEKYFARSLQLLLAILGKPQDVEVIEWSFAALAFLFKYLSKLLVPDLRPTFDLLAPLLGKSRHAPHIARFAAEAMSFLIRKAATPSHRETALVPLVEHVRSSLCSMLEDRQFILYRDGLMTMFAEAIKGTDRTVHSAGSAIMTTLMAAIPEEESSLARETTWLDLVCGVLTSAIHHTDVDTFGGLVQDVLDAVQAKREAIQQDGIQWQLVSSVKILSVLAGVRKGSRISDWNRLVDELVVTLDCASKSPVPVRQDQQDILWSSLISRIAIILDNAPMDAITLQILALNQLLMREPLSKWYIAFCHYFCELNARRFGSLFRGEFQKFVATQGLPSVVDKECIRMPQAWQDQIVSKFERLEISPFPEGGPYDKDPQTTAVHPSTTARISELLLRKLKLALRPSSSLLSDEVHFIASGSVDSTLSPLLRAAVPRFAQSVGFLCAYLDYELSQEGSRQALGRASLQLLKHTSDERASSEYTNMMLQIEQMALSLENTRTIAMLLRKLGQLFVFGMLTVKLSPVWDAAVEALQQIVQTKHGESATATIAFEWMVQSSPRWDPSALPSSGAKRIQTDFECTALSSLEEAAKSALDLAEKIEEALLLKFDQRQHLAGSMSANARCQALKVLNAAPFVAEKRSRLLVPHLLSWAIEEDDSLNTLAEENAECSGSTWSLADRKGILSIFSQFVNPRVLYQSEQVYEALLQLMQNGDAEVQKLALKALLAWKQDEVKPYQENLENLLDDARFKNELAVFMQDANAIKAEHRSGLMPILLRLLYGRTISRRGAGSGQNGLQTTRLAVLRNLSLEDMGSFIDIATAKLKGVRVAVGPAERKKLFSEALIPVRRQMGFLNMAQCLVSELGANVGSHMETLLNAVLYCLVYSCIHLKNGSAGLETGGEENDEQGKEVSLLKALRSLGIKCLMALFQNAQAFDWAPYQDIIIEEVVAPRINNLAAETTQGVSGLLQLFSTWSVLPNAVMFLAPHGDALRRGPLPDIVACLAPAKTKDEVKIFVLEMIRNLVKFAVAPASECEFNELIKEELIDANAKEMLTHVATIIETSSTSINLLEACVETILAFAPVMQDLNHAKAVIQMSSLLLKQPPRRVNPRIKGKILVIVEKFVESSDTAQDTGLWEETYETLSSLFSYFKDRQNRETLSRAMRAFSRQAADLTQVASLCEDLNSFRQGRLDEPDYDRRLAAFTTIAADREVAWTPKQWLPLLHNLIFSIRLDQEFGVLSSNAADGIRRFLKTTADCSCPNVQVVLQDYARTILMPSIYSGAREASETVRREYLRVLGFLLTVMPSWPPVASLAGLLDERLEDSSEPAFFFNVLSPAKSRQLEALRALETANSVREMDSQSLTQFFIPLLEHFIYGRADGGDDSGLGAQAANTIGNLAMSLDWKHWRSTLHRYIGYVESRPETQKQTLRLLGKLSDALTAAAESSNSDFMDVDSPNGCSSRKRLCVTLPKLTQLTTDVIDYFLPPLVKHLHEKDESEVSYRVPVGVVLVKLLKLLPKEDMQPKLAAIVTDICQILRSKAWESREMARDTLIQIAVILGPSFFGFILKQLRGALTRGYQLHVLSYTMHAMLVATVPTFACGDLDYCLAAMVTVVMDDVFGVIGQEKDAQGYISQMKEIKSSKSQDSMELVAKRASIGHLVDLVRPLQALLMQKVDAKMVRKIDALMSRIGSGLLQNQSAASRDTLVFCYEVVQEAYRGQKLEVEEKMDPKMKKYLVLKGAKRSGGRGKTSKHTYKLVRFALDIVRSMMKKHDELRTAANISGFLPIIGDAMIDGEEEVKVSAFRLLVAIVKVPFSTAEGQNIYKVAVKEAFKSISMSSSTTTEISQAALKMLATVLAHRRDIAVRDEAIDMLLGKIKDDFTEPLHRHITFSFLRSVLDRRIETAVVYDTVDHVGSVMVNNDDKETRDLARGAFFQFIREYPQKKARWAKQLDFVVANLRYEREGGRLSVMEVIHLLLSKSSDEFVQEVSGTCFLPLLLVLANDESAKCKDSAGGLLRQVFAKSDKEQTQKFLALLRTWMEKEDNLAVVRLALQVYGYYFESSETAQRNSHDGTLVMNKCCQLLSGPSMEAMDDKLVKTVLETVYMFTVTMPAYSLSGAKQGLWDDIGRCLRHPDAAVKHAAGVSRGEPIDGSHGLRLTAEQESRLCRLALGTLKAVEVDEELASNLVQLLVFVGSRLSVTAKSDDDADEGSQDEAQEEAQEEEQDGIKHSNKEPVNVGYLFSGLSHILRQEVAPKSAALNAKVAAMEILETVSRRASTPHVEAWLKTLLVPLQHLTDGQIPVPVSQDEAFGRRLQGIKTRAQIVMDALQKRVGTTRYSQALLEVCRGVRERREQRTRKRKVEAVTQPEKYGRDKRSKVERNKERRRERAREHRAARQAYKGW
ncbi:hypothetical protein CDD81_4303 [Ophiocordyceps australis]|uniref:Uncharacterized protein n=1 Tax=Ophiocordyceps australis TaxID=1399860 RepID=A0A2C5YC38_9HYPO|nr:hypothetical protein CDD81_4303 [Ophiocordyceps australis]